MAASCICTVWLQQWNFASPCPAVWTLVKVRPAQLTDFPSVNYSWDLDLMLHAFENLQGLSIRARVLLGLPFFNPRLFTLKVFIRWCQSMGIGSCQPCMCATAKKWLIVLATEWLPWLLVTVVIRGITGYLHKQPESKLYLLQLTTLRTSVSESLQLHFKNMMFLCQLVFTVYLAC